MPVRQARGAASEPGSETAPAGFPPESARAGVVQGGWQKTETLESWGGVAIELGGGGCSPPIEPPGPPYFPWVSRTCGFGVRSCGCLDSELTEAWEGKCGFHLPAAQAHRLRGEGRTCEWWEPCCQPLLKVLLGGELAERDSQGPF